MMVLIGIGDFSYQRDDGIYVVPIGCLKNWDKELHRGRLGEFQG